MKKMRIYGIVASVLLLFTTNVMADAYDDAIAEAKARISPVVTDIHRVGGTVGLGTFEPNVEYTLTWKMTSYDMGFKFSALVLYDCTGVTEFECGDKFYDSNKILVMSDTTADAIENTDWIYTASNGTDANATEHTYSVTFTFPNDRQWVDNAGNDSGSSHGNWPACTDGTSGIVARFFQKADGIADTSKSIAVLIGTKQSNSYGPFSRRVRNFACDSN